MRRILGVVAAVAIFSLAAMVNAHEVQYVAYMSGPAESPPNASPGTGTALVTVDLDLAEMHIQADFAGLIGTTSAAHIHGLTALPGVGTAGVMTTTPSFPGFPLGVSAGTYDHVFSLADAGTYNPSFVAAQGSIANAMNTMLSGFEAGRTYFNIHSSAFPGGEIRGFLIPVPEPTCAALGALAAPGLLRRRRRG